MVIRFTCQCGKTLKAPDEYIGKKVSCSKCDHIMRVPEESQEADTPKKKKRPAPVFHDQEVNLPPLSEVRSREEILAESTAAQTAPAPDSSNIAQQMIRQKSSRQLDPQAALKEANKGKAPQKKEQKKSGVKKWMDENKSLTEYLKYNAKLIVSGAVGVIVLCYGLYALMNAMVKTVDHPPLELVSGIVTMDDKPLAHAEVVFVPQEEWKEDKKPASSVGYTDEQGRFELTYLKDIKGAALGKHTVRIFSTERPVPLIYNVKTVLTFDVKESTNNAEFKLVSR